MKSAWFMAIRSAVNWQEKWYLQGGRRREVWSSARSGICKLESWPAPQVIERMCQASALCGQAEGRQTYPAPIRAHLSSSACQLMSASSYLVAAGEGEGGKKRVIY